ncbi:glycosyltransferase family protein [Tritonibacter horizontis]|uniref:Spore protein YkvP/CgeB glycosyl transferase-like domain-containing protein n=1 Tax=Tritonibacter horizontis TaxID=1768241 RepID=A0A132C3G7_9RHOB|nr:hypothetical protein [Tritonibacter horizontis]KUP94610.1 hypothetical protein TRIHO_05360 [Tritonibacter horizontis]
MLTEIWSARGCDKPVHFMPMAGFFQGGGISSNKKDAIAVVGNLGALPAVGAKAANSLQDLVAANCPDGTSEAQISDIVSRVTSETFKGNVAKDVLAALSLPATSLLDPTILRLATAVDRMLRLISRYSKVNSLRGLPVDLYGTGWKEAFPDHEGFTFCGQVAHPEVVNVLGRYKATLNFDPGFEDGQHDRVLSALAQGTHVITNENRFPSEIPSAAEGIHTFPYAAVDICEAAENALLRARGEDLELDSKDLILRHGWIERFYELTKRINEIEPASAN